MAHKITALTMQRRNRQRVNVYLDGEFAFGLARIVAAWLEVGQELSDEKIAQLRADDEREVAYQRALNLLSYRPRSETEIIQNLNKNGVSDEVSAGVMERLRQAGLLDDARFAQAWVENRSDLRPRSRRALNYELQRRGIDEETIQQALEQVDDEQLAYLAAEKYARKLDGLEWPDFRKKLYSFLARRGFNYDVSATVVSQVWNERIENERGTDELSPDVDDGLSRDNDNSSEEVDL